MDKEKSNKVVIWILIGIVVVLLGLCIFLVIDNTDLNKDSKDNNDKNSASSEEVTDKESENNVSKLDDSKEWVYEADYYLPTDKESYYAYFDHSMLVKASDLVVPYVNIDSVDAKKINQEIYDLYKYLIQCFNENLKEEVWFTLVNYETYINDNIISIIITTESGGSGPKKMKYYTYNFDLVSGILLNYEDVYQKLGFSKKDIEDKMLIRIKEKMKMYCTSLDDFEKCCEPTIENYISSIRDNLINFYLDEDGKINVFVTLENPLGMNLYDDIFIIE